LSRRARNGHAFRNLRVVDDGLAVDDAHFVFRHPFQRQRIDFVLDREHALGQCLHGVAGDHRHGGLADNRTLIHTERNEMHRGAVLSGAFG